MKKIILKKKHYIGAFAAAAATVSTPTIAADSYTLRDNNGTEIHVLEMTQSEARDLMQDKIDTQVRDDSLTLEEGYDLKALFNRHFNAGVYEVARAEGYDTHRAQSLANAMTYLYGRDLIDRNGNLSFRDYEFNPNISNPLNGPTPNAIPGNVRASNGERFKVCAVASADDNFTIEQWYEAFTSANVSDGVLPDVYSRYTREETIWHDRANCFFLGEREQANYYGTLQLLRQYQDSDELDSVIEYVRFKADMWMYMSATGVVIESEHVGPASLAALEDFQSQERRLTEEDIWTMAGERKNANGTSIERENSRWEDLRNEFESQAVSNQRVMQLRTVSTTSEYATPQLQLEYKTTITYKGI